MDAIIKIFVFGVAMIFLVALVGIFAAIPLYFLWNWLMPTLFHLPHVTYWQAWGLVWLCGLLFKSSTSSSSKGK